jgi:hypothetical protein
LLSAQLQRLNAPIECCLQVWLKRKRRIEIAKRDIIGAARLMYDAALEKDLRVIAVQTARATQIGQRARILALIGPDGGPDNQRSRTALRRSAFKVNNYGALRQPIFRRPRCIAAPPRQFDTLLCDRRETGPKQS